MIVSNLIDKIWINHMMDMSVYKVFKNEVFRHVFVIFDNFSIYTSCKSLKNKNDQTLRDRFSNIFTNTGQSPSKMELDRGRKLYNCILQNCLRLKNIRHHERFTDKDLLLQKGSSERKVFYLEKPYFLGENAIWINKLPSVFRIYKNTKHNSVKMNPIEASPKI